MRIERARIDTSARRLEWAALTGRQFAELDRRRTVAVVSCSPLEVHGPHLPVMADMFESEAIAVRTMERLAQRIDDLQYVHLPPIYVASDVLPRAGSVMFQPRTVLRVMEDLGRTLAVQGFRHIWVVSFHGGPRHFVPLEMACDRVNRRYGTAMVSVFSLLLQRLTGGRTDAPELFSHLPGLSRDTLEGDAHGGVIETSLLLHLVSELVDPSFSELEPKTIGLELQRAGRAPLYAGERPTLRELLRGLYEKVRYYGRQTYAGRPALATPQLGEQMLEVLTGHATDALADLYAGNIAPEQWRSPLWPVRWIFLNRPLGWAAERAMGYRRRIF
ncbi:MAG: creatininase family protein [Deltaproteobacteria bacterium]|jgi:creatinine amidohydrolase|nr:creatininase family protein [Deltaproteobacteria bacterium]MBW2535742.1 creatininase family protein [Deltaproteobacteria bacterium]